GKLARRFHGLPTNRSHRVTLDVDCPELVARCRADAVDAALLLPNCPVCHQSASLAARALEAAGIATVGMGCAKDIVEYVGVPRLLFPDFRLGNPAGRPKEPGSRRARLGFALDLLAAATGPRTTVQSPLTWSSNPDWKLDFSNVARLSAEEIARRRAEFDQQKTVARELREAAGIQRAASAWRRQPSAPSVSLTGGRGTGFNRGENKGGGVAGGPWRHQARNLQTGVRGPPAMSKGETAMTGSAQRIGWIGMGRMGYPMAERLLRAGHKVSIWNRTRAK